MGIIGKFPKGFDLSQSSVGSGSALAAATPFAPEDIGSIVAWFDADTNITVDGSEVQTWGDKSADNGRNVLGSFGALTLPVLVADVIHGHDVVRFDTLSGMVTVGAPLVPNLATASTGLTMFLVYRTTVDAVQFLIILGDVGGFGAAWLQLTTAALTENGVLVSDSGETDVIAEADNIDDGVPRILTMSWDGTTQTLYCGLDLHDSQANAGPLSYDTLYVGAGTSQQDPLDGDIAEILVYDEALSEANRVAVQRYLANKYNIAL